MTIAVPNDMTNRNATDHGYRFAMITGKSVPFAHPGWGVMEWGSDGGVHNFMKMLEDWSGQTLSYRGSMVSLYFSRQAIGPYRADDNVYCAADPRLQLRHRLPDAGAAAARDADVPRHQHAEVPADPAAEPVARGPQSHAIRAGCRETRPRPSSLYPAWRLLQAARQVSESLRGPG